MNTDKKDGKELMIVKVKNTKILIWRNVYGWIQGIWEIYNRNLKDISIKEERVCTFYCLF